jgi:hypothetical protein
MDSYPHNALWYEFFDKWRSGFFACQFFVLKGGEDYGYDEEAEEEAAAVGDGVDDGIFVELATGGLKPEAA